MTERPVPEAVFEAAVEAVVAGDLPALERLLAATPALVHARSSRPHRATLLHYVAANGVEDERQRTPPNAPLVAKTLLAAGAEVDALADCYGGEVTTLSLLVSSCHPARAGVQVALVDTLVDFGAAVEDRGTGHWISPLRTALAFGYEDAAEALIRRGAPITELAVAAGLGRLDEVARRLPAATAEDRHRGLALAAQQGHVEVVRLLLDHGEDPDRYNPEGNHSHSTPLHQAALAGRLDTVKLLVERGARLDLEDTLYHATPLGWAEHGQQEEVARFLREAEGSRS